MKTTSRFAIAAAAGLVLGGYALQARAADLGGDCCADLEERVAELEATTARKGNRVVSLTISGHVNKTLMIWDDDYESNVYVTDNNISQSRFRFTGSAKIDADVSAGFYIEVSVADNNSSDQTQLSDDAAGNDKTLTTRHVYWWLQSQKLGKLSVGHQSSASDGLADVQLGNTLTAASSGWAGGFFLYNGTRYGSGNPDGLSGVTWGDLEPIFHGGRGDFVRYDSPSLHGFVLSATWGEDDFWDVTLRYAKEWNSIRVAAAIGYVASSDGTGGQNLACQNTLGSAFNDHDADCHLWAGSASVMHVPTGLFVAVAGGEHTDNGWQSEFLDAGGNPDFRASKESDYWYIAGGIQRRWWSYGSTTFYGEYLDSTKASLGVLDENDPLNDSGINAWINGADYSFWGLGVVQQIDAAAMELYVMYRDFDGSLNLVDANGDGVDSFDPSDLSVVFAGARIKF